MAKATGIAQFSQGKSEVFKVDPSLLVITDGWNSRDENEALAAHIDMLAQSIAEIGVLKPIEIKLVNGELIVKDGHCRTRAAMLAISKYGAALKAVPVISVDRNSSDEDLILNQIISNSGKPLTTMEQAKVFKKLLDMGWKQVDIAKKVGMTNGRISQILEFLTLPVALQQYIIDGRVSATMVMSIYKKHNQEAAPAIAEIEAALGNAAAEGRKRAMPKDTEGSSEDEGDSEPKAKKEHSKVKTSGLEAHLKLLIEKAYADGRIDDSESMVTLSMPEVDWAELMEMINY